MEYAVGMFFFVGVIVIGLSLSWCVICIRAKLIGEDEVKTNSEKDSCLDNPPTGGDLGSGPKSDTLMHERVSKLEDRIKELEASAVIKRYSLNRYSWDVVSTESFKLNEVVDSILTHLGLVLEVEPAKEEKVILKKKKK